MDFVLFEEGLDTGIALLVVDFSQNLVSKSIDSSKSSKNFQQIKSSFLVDASLDQIHDSWYEIWEFTIRQNDITTIPDNRDE